MSRCTRVQNVVNGARLVALAALLAAALLSPLDAQNATKPVQVQPPEGFQQQQKSLQITPLDIIREFEAPEEKIYHFGEGDEIAVDVSARLCVHCDHHLVHCSVHFSRERESRNCCIDRERVTGERRSNRKNSKELHVCYNARAVRADHSKLLALMDV